MALKLFKDNLARVQIIKCNIKQSLLRSKNIMCLLFYTQLISRSTANLCHVQGCFFYFLISVLYCFPCIFGISTIHNKLIPKNSLIHIYALAKSNLFLLAYQIYYWMDATWIGSFKIKMLFTFDYFYKFYISN